MITLFVYFTKSYEWNKFTLHGVQPCCQNTPVDSECQYHLDVTLSMGDDQLIRAHKIIFH